jgi:hypothetical protein
VSAALAVEIPRAARSNRSVNAARFLAVPFLAALSACASHEGWAGGSQVVLRRFDALEFRRSEIEVDPRTGELMMHWVGVRANDGMPDILESTLTLFDDANGDSEFQPTEIVKQRTSNTRGRKIQFDDVRIDVANRPRPLMASIEARTEKEARRRRFSFTPDE